MMLNFESECLKKNGLKSINRVYFSENQNNNEQFQTLICTCQWLLGLLEQKSKEYNKFDEPMSICQILVQECKKVGVECTFNPIKLKTGYGEQVVFLLLRLCELAFKRKVKIGKCVIQATQSKQEEAEIVDDGDQFLDLAENIEEDGDEDCLEEDFDNL